MFLSLVLVLFQGKLVGSLYLARLHVLPSRLYHRNATSVNGFDVRLGQIDELWATNELAFHGFGLDLLHDFPAESLDLGQKFGSQAAVTLVLQLLQLPLVLNRSYDGVAVSISKELADEPSDFVLCLDSITQTSLFLKALL